MIIGVTGTTKVGKSTFINDFCSTYKGYIKPKETYRDIPDLDLYESGTEDSQRLIRDFMFKQAKEVWSKRDTNRKVIHDRTLLDNLACSMFLYTQGKVSEEFLVESFEITKKSMSFYHNIYYIPARKKDEIIIPDDIDMDYRGAIDVLLSTMYRAYEAGDDLAKDIFPDKNCTHIDEIFGTRAERIGWASLVLDGDGEILGSEQAESLEELIGTGDATDIYTGDFSEVEPPPVTLKDFGFTDKEIEENITE